MEWSKTLSSMFRKQNQRNARFSEIAEHSRRKEVTLYRDEMSSALTSTSGCIAGRPLSRQ